MFADKLTTAIIRTNTPLIAGFDPDLSTLPEFYLTAAQKQPSNEAAIHAALTSFYCDSIDILAAQIPAIKPNSAFFEQYGVGGFRALLDICAHARSQNLLVILDAKRGDIGSTATAYSRAFLGQSRAFGQPVTTFAADALTVNPFLGFDTLTPFLADCRDHGRGLFVLVRTSNPGSADLQTAPTGVASSADKVAQWLDQHAAEFTGTAGISGLGAVVGATYPSEAQALRALMPNNYFLIPGFGAQGGKAADALAGFRTPAGNTSAPKDAAVVNASRGIFNQEVLAAKSKEDFKLKLVASVQKLVAELRRGQYSLKDTETLGRLN